MKYLFTRLGIIDKLFVCRVYCITSRGLTIVTIIFRREI